MCDEVTVYTLSNMVQASGHPESRKQTAFALRLARELGCYDEILTVAKTKRADWLTWLTLTQRSWQTKVSRRPARGNHHDSWSLREQYVRIAR